MVFPAPAGVILITWQVSCPAYGFPRIRGGDPYANYEQLVGGVFSPHPRG